MTHYRIYLLNEDGHVFQGQDCEVSDDLDALELAAPLAQKHAVEIWRGVHCVAKFRKGGGAMPVDEVADQPESRAETG